MESGFRGLEFGVWKFVLPSGCRNDSIRPRRTGEPRTKPASSSTPKRDSTRPAERRRRIDGLGAAAEAGPRWSSSAPIRVPASYVPSFTRAFPAFSRPVSVSTCPVAIITAAPDPGFEEFLRTERQRCRKVGSRSPDPQGSARARFRTNPRFRAWLVRPADVPTHRRVKTGFRPGAPGEARQGSGRAVSRSRRTDGDVR